MQDRAGARGESRRPAVTESWILRESPESRSPPRLSRDAVRSRAFPLSPHPPSTPIFFLLFSFLFFPSRIDQERAAWERLEGVIQQLFVSVCFAFRVRVRVCLSSTLSPTPLPCCPYRLRFHAIGDRKKLLRRIYTHELRAVDADGPTRRTDRLWTIHRECRPGERNVQALVQGSATSGLRDLGTPYNTSVHHRTESDPSLIPVVFHAGSNAVRRRTSGGTQWCKTLR